MDVTGAAMKVARQPETGRHYPSDRCPVASDGKEKGEREEGKGKRGKELTNWQALHASAIFGVTPEFDKRLDASGYDSARARPLPVQRVPHPPGPRQKTRLDIYRKRGWGFRRWSVAASPA